ncbi:uncharacterized protein LOC119573877 [Penaeus monodon]|uniref:uncharacterized protein LOC119573877 n=1 Tax=Penaeus monodon TaxID=6687 RepID=UPI0018A72FBB|nr:uncharacterized protein LOC119573877 [Penaeus monodon]
MFRSNSLQRLSRIVIPSASYDIADNAAETGFIKVIILKIRIVFPVLFFSWRMNKHIHLFQIEDGYFVHFFAPIDLQFTPKHITFLIDTSQSMLGHKLVQVKDALRHILTDLNAGDTFNIIHFSSASYKLGTMRYTGTAVRKAKKFINSLHARGGTNINDGLRVRLCFGFGVGRCCCCCCYFTVSFMCLIISSVSLLIASEAVPLELDFCSDNTTEPKNMSLSLIPPSNLVSKLSTMRVSLDTSWGPI